MKKALLFCFVLLFLFLSVPALSASSGIVLPSMPIEVAGYDMGYTDQTRFKITDVDYEIKTNSTGSINLKITLKGKKTFDKDDDKEARLTYIRVGLYDQSGARVSSDNIYVGLKMVGFSINSASATFYYLSPGLYTLKFTDAVGSPYYPATPTPAPDLSAYLGTWYADDLWDGEKIHPLGAYAGATIRINSDRTFVFSVPSQTVYSGKWTIYNDWFYVDNDTSTQSFFSSDHNEFFFDLFDGRYIVFFRTAPDVNKFLGTWYASHIWNSEEDKSYPLVGYDGAILQINSNYTYSFNAPIIGDASGSWSAFLSGLYFDDVEDKYSSISGGYLFSPLNEVSYLVYSHTPPAKPTPAPTPEPTPQPTLEPTPQPTPSPVPVLVGDVNADGVIDGRDLLRLAKYFAGLDVRIDSAASDLTGDGSLDGRDLLRLAKHLAGK